MGGLATLPLADGGNQSDGDGTPHPTKVMVMGQEECPEEGMVMVRFPGARGRGAETLQKSPKNVRTRAGGSTILIKSARGISSRAKNDGCW